MPAYATVADLRAYAPNVADATDADDVLLSQILDRATALIEEVLTFQFFRDGATYPAASARSVWAEESVWLRLPPYQAGSLSPIAETVSGTVVTDAFERPEAGVGYLWREQGWQGKRYTVTAAWGYGPPPAAIVETCLEVAVNLARGKDRGMYQEVQTAANPSTGQSGGLSLRFIGGLTSAQRDTVERVKRRYLGGWSV